MVFSTTRYRVPTRRKKTRDSGTSLKRQMSGAKGGRATRDQKRRKKPSPPRDAPSITAQRVANHFLQNHEAQHANYNSPSPYPPTGFTMRPSPQPMMVPQSSSQYFGMVPDWAQQLPQQSPASYMMTPTSYPQLQMSQPAYKYDEADPVPSVEEENNITYLDNRLGALFADADSSMGGTPDLIPGATSDEAWSYESMSPSPHVGYPQEAY